MPRVWTGALAWRTGRKSIWCALLLFAIARPSSRVACCCWLLLLLALAHATDSHVHAFGIDWDNTSGTNNGHFAPFNWQG